MFNLLNDTSKWLFAILTASLLIFAGCSEDDPTQPPDGPGDEEVITTVTLTLTPQGGGNQVIAQWQDLDGDGGNAPTIGSMTLNAGATYDGSITLLNEQESPAENVTEEIEDEDDEHQFYYTPMGGIANSVTVNITDQDGNGLPIGLSYTVTVNAGTSGQTGTLDVKLYHYDEVTKTGTNITDEIDVDIQLPVTIN